MLLLNIRCVSIIHGPELRPNCPQKYHSIHARGERVEDAIKGFESHDENVDLSSETVLGPQAGAKGDTAAIEHLEELEDGEVDEVDEGEVERSNDYAVNEIPQNYNHKQTPHQTLNYKTSSPPGMPAAVTAGVNNEPLRNLMMSWYYAGYYTGFYEGHNTEANTAAA